MANHMTAFVPGRPSHPTLFWIGVGLITAGVLLHFYDFLQMPELWSPTLVREQTAAPEMAAGTLGMVGMAIDLLGVVLATWALLPPHWLARFKRTDDSSLERLDPGVGSASLSNPADDPALLAMDSTRLTGSHWRLLGRLYAGVTLDTMKPATLAFVLPGMRAEYGLSPAEAAAFPFSALAGLTLGSVVFGRLGDVLGRRTSFLITALIMAGTAICGLMPTFPYQLFMCFLMGLVVGGELPVIYTLLAEMVPARHRGWLSVMLGGLGGLTGFLVAAALAFLLEPTFGWRVLFVSNLPTALFMLLLMRWVPESPRLLLQTGHVEEARKVMAQVGVSFSSLAHSVGGNGSVGNHRGLRDVFSGKLLGTSLTLCLFGFAWGLCNWGFITWLPSMLRDMGHDAAVVSRMLATSALFALPGTVAAAALYGLWSSKRSAVLFALATSGMLVALALAQPSLAQRPELVGVLVVGLLIASSSMIGVLAPYSVELYPTDLRGVGSGVVAASSKSGGLVGPGLVGVLLGLSPGLALPALVISTPIAIAGVMMAVRGIETRGRRLEELTEEVLGREPHPSAATASQARL